MTIPSVMNDIDEGDKKRILIIGGGVAGMTLAMDLVRKNENLKITVIKKERQGSYSPCGMPFVLEGKVARMEDIVLHSPDFYMDKGINLKTESEAIAIDLNMNSVKLASGEILNYDVLVLATGRKPFIPPLKGIDLEGVYTINTYDDGVRLMRAIPTTKKAVIIGGGIIGLETAAAFASKNIQTTVIEMLPSIFPQILDPDMASILQKKLESMGIKIYTSTKISSIEGDRNVEQVVTDSGEFKADIVVISTGIRSNVDLGKEAGISIGKSGGIITSSSINAEKDGKFLKNVFALGDCVEVKNKITQSSQISALASTAALQSRVIATNICGGKAEIDGYLSPTITVCGGLQVGSVGLTSQMARKNGIELKIGKASGSTRSSYYPEGKQIHIKLLAQDERLIGAQIISEEDVKEKVNVIALAIQNGLTIGELYYSERCFTPPLGLLTDPLIRALESFG